MKLSKKLPIKFAIPQKNCQIIFLCFYNNNNLLSNNITPVYIFDGKPPIEKSEVIKCRQEKAKAAKTALENAIGDETCSDSTKDKLEKKTKFYQAGTSEMFGKVQETPQNEKTCLLYTSPSPRDS